MLKKLKNKIDLVLPSKKSKIAFLILLLIAAFVRFYRLEDLTIFLDDQARDVLIAAKTIKEADIPFIGPMASIGNLYLGPIFYWAITPFLALANFNPVGPIVLIGLLSLLTTVLLFLFMNRYFSSRSAFVAAGLYALSPLVVTNSRFIWNPNPVPLFSLIFLWAFVEFWPKPRPRLLLVVGLALGVLIQLHYVTGVLFIATFIALLVWIIKNKPGKKTIFKSGLSLLLGIFLPLIPFILFEIKNHFINTKAGWQFIFTADGGSQRLLSPGQSFIQSLTNLTQESLAVNWGIGYFLVCLVIFIVFGLLSRRGKNKRALTCLVLFIFFFTLLVTVLVVRGQIHLHYLGLLLPLVFIIIGGADYYWQKVKFLRLFSLGWLNFLPLLLILLAMVKFNYEDLTNDSNHQIERAQKTAAYIAQIAEDKNIFVTSLSGSPYAYPYRYYLYLDDFVTDSLQPSSVFAICETEACADPEGHPLWEIAQFGVLKTVSVDHVAYGVWVYQLKSQ